MSRIYEALKSAEESRSKSGVTGSDGLAMMEMPERRADPRQALDDALTVYGHAVDEAPFYEQARAVKGNSQGGMFLLAVPVSEGQELLLINNRTSQEQLCRVVNFMVRDAQTGEVSVAFPVANPEFW